MRRQIVSGSILHCWKLCRVGWSAVAKELAVRFLYLVEVYLGLIVKLIVAEGWLWAVRISDEDNKSLE